MSKVIQLPLLELRWYQQPAWNARRRDKIKRLCMVHPRRNGKDILSLNILIAEAVETRGLYFYMAPYYQQVRTIIWEGMTKDGKPFIDYIPRELIEKKHNQDMRIYLKNGSQIKLCGSDNIDSIVGSNPIGIVFTEFSLHKPEAWDYLRPILAENGGWAIFNGTPRGLNHFHQLSMAAKANPKTWFYQYLTRDDTGIPSLEAIEEDRRNGMPESLIQQEYYCSWNASTEETLIPLELIEPCIDSPINYDDYQHLPMVLGVDPAYSAKGDLATIARRQGRFLWPLEKHRGLDPMALASRVADKIVKYKVQLCFIDAGRGEGVISRLWQLGFENIVIPVDFASTPYNDLYANKKTEIYCNMRDWYLAPKKPHIPHDKDLIADTSSYTADFNERGKLILEPKKSVKKRLRRSTDCSDCVAVTFAEPTETLEYSATLANLTMGNTPIQPNTGWIV